MEEQKIKCPACGAQIELSKALSSELENKMKLSFERTLATEKERLAKEAQAEKARLAKEVASEKSKLENMLEEEKRKLWATAQKKAKEKLEGEFSKEMKDLREANAEKEKKLLEMEEHELKLRKLSRELHERERSIKLEITRKLDEERKNLVESERSKLSEEYRLKMLEKDKQHEQMKRTIEELKRKSEQGSMQIQGDVQENDLKRVLCENFPVDLIEDVPTGIRGADLIHTVRNDFGVKCGVILWESKNTKAWVNDWLKKLKDDQTTVKADICVIVSQVLPEGVCGFKNIGGVWVCDYKMALPLTNALRMQIVELNMLKSSMVGRDEKMELLYKYLSSAQFKNRVENIVQAFMSLKSELDREKRSFQRLWSRREKEIERVMNNTVGMYGDLQGLIGGALPEIKNLELPDGEE